MTLDDDSAILTLPPSPPESLAPGNLGLSPSSSPPPILLRFPLHRRASRLLHLEPIGRASWTVARGQREGVRELIARTAVEPPSRAVLPGNDAEAVMSCSH